MLFMVGFILGMFIGANVALILYVLIIAKKKSEEEAEKM